ncbi:MAG: DinB family protein [Vicinamibacterales bacterium]
MRLMRSLCTCAVTLALAAPAFAQNPATAAVKGQFGMISGVLARTAEKIPENLYTFKATPEVRSIAQLIGHIADSHFSICAAAAGEKPAQSGIEKSMTTKADLSKALADSSAYCNKVIDGMTDAKGMEVIKFFTGPTPRLMVLTFNVAHSYEHYGNLVTYMRLNKIVPPSSERSGMD